MGTALHNDRLFVDRLIWDGHGYKAYLWKEGLDCWRLLALRLDIGPSRENLSIVCTSRTDARIEAEAVADALIQNANVRPA